MQNLHRIVSRISSISPFNTRSSIPWRNFSTISSSNPSINTANEHDSWAESWENSDPDFNPVFSFPTELAKEGSNEEILCRQSVCEKVSSKNSTTKDKQVGVDIDVGFFFTRLTEKIASVNPPTTSSTLSSSSLNEGGEFAIVEEVLDDASKDEMYKLHKENPQVYTIEKLAIDYGVMLQRVSAVLFLKEIEEEEGEEMKKLGHSLDDYVEMLLDGFPEFSDPQYSEELNVSSLPYERDLTVMHEGWNELLEILRKCAMRCQSRRMKCYVKN